MSNNITVTRSVFDEVMIPCYSPMPMIPVKGEGSRVWDQNGQDYIDFAAGIAVSCLGHCHPALTKSLIAQSQKLWHLSNVMTNEPALQLAHKLVNLTFADKVFFANSGAEANEAALKLARRYAADVYGAQKNEIISFTKSFHGRTFFTVTVGGQPSYSDNFGPKPEAIHHVPYNDIEAIKAIISDKTCAVMVEPIQGEGGIIVPDADFLPSLRALCDQFNALLIFDEVQTGNGRTGHFYAYQEAGVVPDILATAKSLGGGFPIGAMLTTDEIASHFVVGTHGSTYGGNPLACAVANTVIDIVSQEDCLKSVAEKEALFRQYFAKLNDKFPIFAEMRGKGLLLGMALNDAWQGRAREILKAAGEHGVLILIAGPSVIRMTPSLVITEEEISEGFARLEEAIETLMN